MKVRKARAKSLGPMFIACLLAATFVSRVALVSQPYFADGPAHVRNIGLGKFIMQPPGYFVFNLSGWLLTRITLSPALSVTFLNVCFGVLGVYVFAKICERVFGPPLMHIMSACYAAMNVVWFASLIHSTYAPMTFFGPAVFYCVLRSERKWFLVGCATWALGAGFRPSDGFFLLPLLCLASVERSWSERFYGASIAAVVASSWWIPTAVHYGNILGPISAAAGQAASVSGNVSIVRVGVTPRSLANVLRFVTAVGVSMNVLLPLAGWQCLRSWGDRVTRLSLMWILPGSLFLMLIYMSDAVYITFMAGGWLLLAGLCCHRWDPRRATALLAVFIVVSTTYMLACRPVAPTSFPRRVANAFCLEYTAWGAKHQYRRNLSDMERDAGMLPNE
ncbi:MAG: glycosyltransferase family 39 protein [Acidobacteria bacterium]|nr:glycosyltransferase family 39 protein [Acidobacteriota bacterium]